jgi:hypothetical protein
MATNATAREFTTWDDEGPPPWPVGMEFEVVSRFLSETVVKKMIGRTGEEIQQCCIIDSGNYVHNTENVSTNTRTQTG